MTLDVSDKSVIDLQQEVLALRETLDRVLAVLRLLIVALKLRTRARGLSCVDARLQ